MNRSVTSELLWLFFDRGNELVRHNDKDFKLPVQYLVDNAASSTETTALLISGPASYRHRYEFLSATAPCICITQGSELVYIQTNVAMDSNSAANVLVTFYSSQTAVEHEHEMLLHLKAADELEGEHGGYSPVVYETFEGAKRRVTLRSTHVAPEDQKGYHLLTGKKLLERLAPWSEFVGHDQSLHLVCSLTDDVLAPLIAEVDPEFRPFLQRTLRVADGSLSPSFAISETSSHEVIGDALEQKTNCALVDGPAGPRAAKHAQDQLEFMKKEQAHLRHTLLATKAQLRGAERMCTCMQTEAQELRVQLATVTQQKQEVQQEVQVFAHNHQAMTLQLHTTVQMLLNLIPLARKASGGSDAASLAFQKETAGSRRQTTTVQLVKTQLQHSVLARGCVQKWANSNGSTALAATQQASASDEDDDDLSSDIDAVSTGDGDVDKPSGYTGDSEDVAAAMA
ncbi:hypothetical protein BBJ28_00004847 [Nothophytophthora sp. Chile5]|nr:hypothetical protein BBJ28_00004847 [Nothophytophthora sp. Chile5]